MRFLKINIFWISIIILCVSLILISHLFFQKYLFMQPCEQCVYIRFDFCIIIIGSILALIKSVFFRVISYVVVFYGVIQGILDSFYLRRIYKALHSQSIDDIFGLQGCLLEPKFPFNIALDKYNLFKVSGDCGYDNPIIPQNISLDSIQEFFINIYSNGWYLIPKYQILSMPETCLIIFSVLFLALIVRLFRLRIFKRF
ncbi:disulfide bond formation protein B [Helicobacter sp. MIT 14-3879]|uniref:disulfide bond formation protein B n=1 Tax=Helicobacter sp. MIT 14-3879 TaxID=2040649 RepID=UPI0015F181D9|nr:disulfide bond formation protein B [Helicobacter sp. MIT 14-3879]